MKQTPQPEMRYDDATSAIIAQSFALARMHNHLLILQNSNDLFTAEAFDLRQKLDMERDQHEKTRRECEILENHMHDLKDSNEAMRKECDELLNRDRHMQERIAALESKLREVQP